MVKEADSTCFVNKVCTDAVKIDKVFKEAIELTKSDWNKVNPTKPCKIDGIPEGLQRYISAVESIFKSTATVKNIDSIPTESVEGIAVGTSISLYPVFARHMQGKAVPDIQEQERKEYKSQFENYFNSIGLQKFAKQDSILTL